MRWRIAVPPDCATPVRSTLNHGYEKAVGTVAMSNGPAASRVNCPLGIGAPRDSRVTHPEFFAQPCLASPASGYSGRNFPTTRNKQISPHRGAHYHSSNG